MIIPDINLLVYAYNADAPDHPAAKQWLETVLNESVDVGLPWAVTIGFIRLTTHTRVLVRPYTAAQAVGVVRAWFAVPSVRAVAPGPRHLDILEELLGPEGVAGPLTTDAHLAALAIEHRAALHSNDADFSRFSGLRWMNPLTNANYM